MFLSCYGKGGGEHIVQPCLCFALAIGKKKLLVMTKAVTIRDFYKLKPYYGQILEHCSLIFFRRMANPPF